MKKYLKGKNILLGIIIIIIILGINKYIKDWKQRPVKMKEELSIYEDGEIESAHLTDDSIITWDKSKLRFYNLKGEKIEEILGNGYFTNIYYFENEIAVLDKQLNVLYIYDSTGDMKEKTQLTGNVYSIFKKEGDIYLHKKDEKSSQRTETISRLEGNEKESPIYQTKNFIINFTLENDELLVSEITAENYSYKTILNRVGKSDSKHLDFGNETIIDMKKYGDDIIAITNKNLYKIEGNNREKIELNNFRDYRFEEKRIVILYDNRLVFFNKNLEEKESYEIRITNTGILTHDGGYFVYGPTDIVGFLGERREFQKSFDSIVYRGKARENGILVRHKYNVELFIFEPIEEE